MKKLIIFMIHAIVYAGSYISVHQIADPGVGFLGEINASLENININQKIPDIGGGKIDFSVTENAKLLDQKKKKWCGNNFPRYKVYVPASRDIPDFRITVGVVPNSTIYMAMHFIPQDRILQIKEINWTKRKFWSQINRQDLDEFFKGNLTLVQIVRDVRGTIFNRNTLGRDIPAGWLYLQFIGASNIEYAQYRRSSYKVIFAFEYRGLTKERVRHFIEKTVWNKETNDPIDGFEKIMEIEPYCNNYGIKEPVYGVKDGKSEFLFYTSSSLSESRVSSSNSSSQMMSSMSSLESQNSSSSSIVMPIQNNSDDEEKRKECEAKGKQYIDGVCIAGKNGLSSNKSQLQKTISKQSKDAFPESQNSSSSSIVMPIQNNSDDEEKRKECEAKGKQYIDGVCIAGSNNDLSSDESSQSSQYKYNSSSSSVNKIEEQKIKKIVGVLAHREFRIKGYFTQYGNGAFDWIYITPQKGIYKLDGMKKDGTFKWTDLTKYFDNVEINNYTIRIGKSRIK